MFLRAAFQQTLFGLLLQEHLFRWVPFKSLSSVSNRPLGLFMVYRQFLGLIRCLHWFGKRYSLSLGLPYPNLCGQPHLDNRSRLRRREILYGVSTIFSIVRFLFPKQLPLISLESILRKLSFLERKDRRKQSRPIL